MSSAAMVLVLRPTTRSPSLYWPYFLSPSVGIRDLSQRKIGEITRDVGCVIYLALYLRIKMYFGPANLRYDRI